MRASFDRADHLVYADWTEQPRAAFDPWITMAGIATRTDDVTPGTWVTTLPRRQPWQVARNLATLDHLSNGRVPLGAGLGAEPLYTTFGEPRGSTTLGEKYDEALDVITDLWSGEPFSYDGDHYTVDEATMLPTPCRNRASLVVMGCWWPNKKPFARGPTTMASCRTGRRCSGTGSTERERDRERRRKRCGK
ncbi:MAG: LLM class flavin-dependent oxidoreductase [Halovenus sp.]